MSSRVNDKIGVDGRQDGKQNELIGQAKEQATEWTIGQARTSNKADNRTHNVGNRVKDKVGVDGRRDKKEG